MSRAFATAAVLLCWLFLSFSVLADDLNEDLLYRVQFGNAEDVRMLIDKGAYPNITNKNGVPVLILAARRKDAESVRLIETLLSAGANINIKDQSGGNALFAAAKANNLPAVNMLLEKGIDYYQTDKEGHIARSYAYWSKHGEIVDAMDRFVNRQRNAVEEEYRKRNEQIAQERMESAKPRQKEPEKHEAMTDGQYAQYRRALDISYKQALEDAARKRSEIKTKSTPGRFNHLLRGLSFHACAYEYWSYCQHARQTTEFDDPALTETIARHRSIMEKLGADILQSFSASPAYIETITTPSQKAVLNELRSMHSNTYRRENGVGKIDDMAKRCNAISRRWEVNAPAETDENFLSETTPSETPRSLAH